MTVTVLNCVSENLNHCIDESLQRLSLSIKYDKADIINAEQLNISFCKGCWSCWLKTPGRCIHNDDTEKVLRSVINSDMVIFVTDTPMGFVNHRMKKICDKMIPLIHPYITLVNNELHHEKRYESYPKLGIVLIPDNHFTSEDKKIIYDCYKRMAINFHSSIEFCIEDSHELGGLKNELCNI